MRPPTRRSGPGGGRSEIRFTADTHSPTSTNNPTARLDEEADKLLIEAARFMEAGDSVLAAALLEDSHEALTLAAAHALVTGARARRLLSAAVHLDLERVA